VRDRDQNEIVPAIGRYAVSAQVSAVARKRLEPSRFRTGVSRALSRASGWTSELSRLLEAVLSRMSEKRRVTFVMYELDKMSGEEIAQVLGVPLGTVRSRLNAARGELQAGVKALYRRKPTTMHCDRKIHEA
jgi:RNA polymerase sigma factor (sigma-70 family)